MRTRMPSRELIGRAALKLYALIAVVYFVLPLTVIIGTSFTTTAYLKFPPEGFSLQWYAKFLNDKSYLHSLLLSGTLALSATITAAVLGIPVALALSRGELPGKKLISAFFLSPLILPPIVVGAALLQFATVTGIARTFFALYRWSYCSHHPLYRPHDTCVARPLQPVAGGSRA